MSRLLVLRADADNTIGAGHLMRCLALAQEWQTRGGTAVFVSRCLIQSLRERLLNGGFGLVHVERPWPDPSDLELTVSAAYAQDNNIRAHGAAVWVALDGYHFDVEYHRALKSVGLKLLVVDNTALLPSYHADIILNEDLEADQLSYPTESETTLLLGSRFVLLREEFLAWRGWTRDIPPMAGKILVTLGGGSQYMLLHAVLRALGSVDLARLHVKVVAGREDSSRAELHEAVSACPHRVDLLTDVRDMSRLMAWADAAICGAGSTLWELGFMKLPAVVLKTGMDQELMMRALERMGLCLTARSEIETPSESLLAGLINTLVGDRSLRSALSRKMAEQVDGLGATRVVEAMHSHNCAVP